MIWCVIALLALFIIAAAVAVAAIYCCYDDDDPDQFWADNYAGPPKVSPWRCRHPAQARYTKIKEQIVNCETTVTACALCGKELTEPETDCR